MGKLELNNELLPLLEIEEVIYLESEHFERALLVSNQITNQEQRWQTYIKMLALSSFEEWLSYQVPSLLINIDYDSLTSLCYLNVNEFNICIITTENLADVVIPSIAIESPKYLAHFYILIEVLEEQEEAVIKGCLRYDKLIHYQQVYLLTKSNDNYEIPLYLFDVELNHFLRALQLLAPNAIMSIPNLQSNVTALSNNFTTLSSWLSNPVETNWLTIEELLNTNILRREIVWQIALYRSEEEIVELINQLCSVNDESQRQKAAKKLGTIAVGNDSATQALINLLQTTQDEETLWTAVESLWKISPGNPAAGTRRVKLIDFGMQVAGETVALAVAIIQKSNQRFGVLLQIYPTNNKPYLPANLKLILLDGAGKVLPEVPEVKARQSDNCIQLKLTVQKGEEFSVRVAYGDNSITENFQV